MIIKYQGEQFNLPNMHTKQLLNLLRSVNKGPYCECCHSPEFIEQHIANLKTLVPLIKAELDTREHVPNKQEAKELRKQKALLRVNKSNRKYRNR